MERCFNCMKLVSIQNHKCNYCGFDASLYEQRANSLPVGTILKDRLLIGVVLGTGGFGITYKAWDKELDVPMAVKEFMPRNLAVRKHEDTTVIPTSGDKETFAHYMEKFLDEARTLARFSNESGIVSIQDVFRENGTIYIVMYYVDGIDLNTYLKQHNNQLSLAETMRIMKVIMTSLSKVHGSGLIHRDISPDNIYITDDGEVKLLDFGAARYTIGTGEHTLSVILKHGYAPVEQYKERGLQGPWTDVYAVGATIYRMLTGSKPVNAIEQATGAKLPALREHGVIIPNHIEGAILKSLSVDSKDRFQTMNEFIYALENSEYDTVLLHEAPVIKQKRKINYLYPILLVLIVSTVYLGIKFTFNSQQHNKDGNVTSDSVEMSSNINDTGNSNQDIESENEIIEEEMKEENAEDLKNVEEVTVEEEKVTENENEELKQYGDFKMSEDNIYASSEFFEVWSGGTIYNYAINVFDDNPKTGWVENVKGEGIGEWIAFDSEEIGYVHSISIINGYTKSSDLFYWNDRLKRFKLTFSDGSTQNFTLMDDRFDFQKIDLKEPVLTDSVKLTILEVYPGSKYSDCYITEIRIN